MTGKLVAMTTITAEPTWLDDGEQRAWRAYLRGSRLLEAALDRDLQQHGVPLSEQPDRRLRMSALADMVVQSRSRLTHTASRLEKRGWVQREACVGDRRGVELVLTDAGFEAITAMARVHVASVREHLLSHLTSAQFAALGAAMTSIADGIEAGGACDEARAAEPA